MERRLSRRACTERERHTYTDTWCVCVYICVSEQLAGEHVRRENAIHTLTRGVCVCVWVGVCVCVCGTPVPKDSEL